MDFPCGHLLGIAGIVMGLVLLWYNHHRSSGANRRHNYKGMSPPEPAGAWPIVGHLLHLLSKQAAGEVPIFRTFASMADEVGPVFVIRLGMFPTVVVSDHEAAKECFTTNDKIFAARPKSAAAKILGYNGAMFSLAPHGDFWRQIRKLSTSRLNELVHVRVSELQAGIGDLYNNIVNNCTPGPAAVVMCKWFDHLNFNVILRMVAGKRYFTNLVHGSEEARSPVPTFKKLVCLAGATVASDAIPFLEWLDLQGHLSSMKHVAEEVDVVLEGWLEEHKGRRTRLDDDDNINNSTRSESDVIDVMLTKFQDGPLFGYPRDTIIKAATMSVLFAGYETTSVTSIWLLSALLNNKHVMKRAQEELDLNVGRDRWVELSDIHNLVYLKAIVKETLRLYPPLPLLLPHEAMEDCLVGGFHIRKGTRLLVNAWKIHRDPAIWSNPEEFMPERFLTDQYSTLDVFGKHFELIPFGSGRRLCPGINVALQMLHLTMARLLQGFDMTPPSDSPIDMTEGLSVTMPKATPLEVMLTPRLRPELY